MRNGSKQSKNPCTLNGKVTSSDSRYLKLGDKNPVSQGSNFTNSLQKSHPSYFIFKNVGGCLQTLGYIWCQGGQNIFLGGKRNKFKFGVRLKELNLYLRQIPQESDNRITSMRSNFSCFFITQKARLILSKEKNPSLTVKAAGWGVGIKEYFSF